MNWILRIRIVPEILDFFYIFLQDVLDIVLDLWVSVQGFCSLFYVSSFIIVALTYVLDIERAKRASIFTDCSCCS